MYYHGDGVPQDHAKAALWYRRAAEQGYALAQSYLGGMYFRGDGVPQDYALAFAWSNLAEMSGGGEVKWTKRMKEFLTAEQIQQGQALSITIFNRINEAPTE